MANHELAKMFFEIGEMLNEKMIPHKPRVYQNAAVILDSLQFDLGDLYKEGGINAIKDIPGIGDGIASKIEEYLTTGNLEYYLQLKQEIKYKI
ncbi:hypothetical protein KBC01_00865 [Candidatus Parcubacteria bacterium]|nr:hypothetical protein [Candidatus Parcubacteria bacterium]HQI74824.1 hypothetical protein [Candidatus Pacearchaeota archaeon]